MAPAEVDLEIEPKPYFGNIRFYGVERTLTPHPRDPAIHPDRSLNDQFSPRFYPFNEGEFYDIDKEFEADQTLRDLFTDSCPVELDYNRKGYPKRVYKRALTYYVLHPDHSDYHLFIKHLKRDSELASGLGFRPDNIPQPSALSDNWWERFSSQERKDLFFQTAQKALYCARHGIEVADDLAGDLVFHVMPESHRIYPSLKPDPEEVKEEKKQAAAAEVRPLLRQTLDLDRPDTGTRFDDIDFIDLMTYLSREGKFLTAGAEDYADETPPDVNAPGGGHLRGVLGMMSEEGRERKRESDEMEGQEREARWIEQTDQIIEELIALIQSYGLFTGELTLALDATTQPYFLQGAEEPPDECVKMKGDDTAKWCYHRLTIAAVDSGRSFKLGSVRVEDLSKVDEAAIELIDHAYVGWNPGVDQWERILVVSDPEDEDSVAVESSVTVYDESGEPELWFDAESDPRAEDIAEFIWRYVEFTYPDTEGLQNIIGEAAEELDEE